MKGLVISFVEVPISSSTWKEKEKETMRGFVIFFQGTSQKYKVGWFCLQNFLIHDS